LKENERTYQAETERTNKV